jgi:hypothetical protein
MGPPLDMYGGILHNAAVCHLEASNSVTGDSAEDTTATTFKNKKEALERALLLSTEAVAARTMFSKQQGIPYDELQNHVINKESNNLLFLSKELMRSIEQRLVIEVGVDGKRHEPQQQQHTYTEADFDDEEWEECVEGEEGCEAFVISDASPPPAHALASVQVSSSKNKALNNMDIDIEDVIDMDVGLSGLQDGGLSRSSQGLENTLDGLDSFMQNLQATETNTGKPSGTVASTILKREVQEEEQEEEQEWEECEAGESGCESFYVTEDTNDNGPTLTRVTENNEEDIDDEDERELAATREMWAKQTASFAGR